MATASFADVPKRAETFEDAEKLLARGMLEKAALEYGAFAQNAPLDPRAPWAFVESSNLHMRLGYLDFASAEENLQTFENTFVPVNLELWSDLALTMIDGFANRNDRQTALILARRALTIIEDQSKTALKKKSVDLKTWREIEIRTRSRLARFYATVGDHHGSDAEHARIQKIVPELGVWPSKKPPRTTAKFPETMDLIAESFFYVAEAKRREAERLLLPAYIGNGDRDSVLLFINGPGTRWIENRRYLVEEAVRLYHFIIGVELPKPIPPKPPPPPIESGMIGLLNAGGDPNAPIAYDRDDSLGRDPLEPLPSPKWAIAAAERVGSLWASYVREYSRMPIPKPQKLSGPIPGTDLRYEDLRYDYGHSFLEPSAWEFKETAKSAYRECLNLSIRSRIVNEHTRACIKWLSKNFGAEYRVEDEFTPPGEFVAFGQYARPAPLPMFTR